MKDKYTEPTIEIIEGMNIRAYYASSDIFFEDNEGYSPVFTEFRAYCLGALPSVLLFCLKSRIGGAQAFPRGQGSPSCRAWARVC